MATALSAVAEVTSGVAGATHMAGEAVPTMGATWGMLGVGDADEAAAVNAGVSCPLELKRPVPPVACINCINCSASAASVSGGSDMMMSRGAAKGGGGGGRAGAAL